MKHSLKRFVTVLTKYNKIEVYCTSIRFHNRSFGSIIDPKTCPNETRWPYHMKSKTFSRLIPTIESPSLSPNTEKQKHLSYSVSHTYTQIKWRFSNFVIKSGPSRLICYKTQFFNILCLPGSTWNWNDKLKSLCVYLFDRDVALLSCNYTKPVRL